MDDESSVRSSAVRGNFTFSRHPLASLSSVLKVPNNPNFLPDTGYVDDSLDLEDADSDSFPMHNSKFVYVFHKQ